MKPTSRLDDPETAAVFDWTGDVCAQHDWDYEVWSGASETMLWNIKMLACARRSTHLDRQICKCAIKACDEPRAFDDIVRGLCTSEAEELVVRPVILHLLWRGILTADMKKPITERTRLTLRKEEIGEFNL